MGAPSTNSEPTDNRRSFARTGSSSSKPSLGEMKSGGLKTDKNVLTPINSEPSNSGGLKTPTCNQVHRSTLELLSKAYSE
jgi:hypothetical protein